MAALNPFNPDDVEDDGFTLCPAGEGVAQIVNSSLKEIDPGLLLNLEYEILDGPLQGKHAFEGLFQTHANPQVTDIAARSLKRLCGAVGHVGVLTDSEQLHFKPFHLKVTIKPDKKGVDRNNFSYSPIGGAGASTAAVGAASGAAKTPWGKKAAA